MRKSFRRRRTGKFLVAAAAAAAAAGMEARTALAVEKYYVGPASGASAVVNLSANWSLTSGGAGGAGVPNGGDSMRIQHNDATSRSILLDTNITLTGGIINAFSIGNTGAGTTTFTQTAGGAFNLSVGWEDIGSGVNAHGVYTQSTGINHADSYIIVGSDTGATGTYNLSGGTVTIGGQGGINGLFVGYDGIGIFNHIGGTVTSSYAVYIGAHAGSTGTYNISGAGVLSATGANRIAVGSSGNGTMNVTAGGYVTASNFFIIGDDPGSVGTVTVSGSASTVTATGETDVGDQGAGTLNISSGGVVNSNGGANIAASASSNSTATVSTGGTWNVTGNAAVGGYSLAGGTGVLNISGGAATVTGALKVWNTGAASPGGTRVNLSGGTLSVGSLDTDGHPERFDWTGGTLQFGSTAVIAPGAGLGASRTIASGMSLLAPSLEIGNASSGAMTQNGGSITVVNTVTLRNASFLLNGGSLTSGASNTSLGFTYVGRGGAGTFTQTGGTHTPFYLHVGEDAGATYTLSNGNLNATGDERIGRGTFTQTGGTHLVSGIGTSMGLLLGEIVGDTGTFDLQGGSLTVDHGVSVAYFGTGIFTQSGGTHVVNSSLGLSLGVFSQGTGTYSLSGTGALTVNAGAYVGGGNGSAGGTGILNISGGTATVTGAMKVWNSGATSPSGTRVNLSGGTLSVGSLNTDGNPSRFNWTGGTLVVDPQGQNYSNPNQFGAVGPTGQLGSSLAIGSTKTLRVGDPAQVNWTYSKFDGNVAQTGGENSIYGSFFLGVSSNTSYSLSGGTLFTGAAFIGYGTSGAGSFTQTGGTFTAEQALYPLEPSFTVGFGAAGTYSLSGSGVLRVNDDAEIGGYVNGPSTIGIMNISGGSATVTGRLKIYDSGPASPGGSRLSVSGGTLSVNTLELPSADRFNFTNGTLNLNGPGTSTITGTLNIAPSGSGNATLNQTGGTTTVSGRLYLSGTTIASSTYVLSSGSLSVATQETIGQVGNATFTQTGGSNAIAGSNGLILGDSDPSHGTYTLNGAGASLTVIGERVGNSAIGTIVGGVVTQPGGTFNQLAGTHTVTGDLYVAYLGSTTNYVGSSGAFTLSGGTLKPAALHVGYRGKGVFTQSGGTSTGTSLVVGEGATALGTYTMNENAGPANLKVVTETIGSSATGTGGTQVQSGGAFIQSAGTHTVSGTLTIASASGSTGAFNLSGGTLSAATERIGAAGAGAFVQSGGTHTVFGSGNPLRLGDSAGSVATYALSGGNLTVINNTVGANGEAVGFSGNATFNQTGGTHDITGTNGNLVVGYTPTGVGTYLLAAGTLQTKSLYVASQGGSRGLISQTGGTATVTTDFLDLGLAVGAIGRYELSGGTLSAPGVYVGGISSAARGTGLLTISAGAMSVNAELKIWNSADTALNFSGGSLTVGSVNNLGTINYLAGAGGVRQISGGAVTSSGVISGVDGTPNTLRVSSLSLTGGTLGFDLGSPGSGDMIDVLGALSLSGTTYLGVNNLGGLASGTYTLIDYAGSLTGTVANLASGTAPAGFTYTPVVNPGNSSIDLVVVSSGDNIWNGGTSNWNTPAMWNGGTVPNSSAAHVRIDNSGGTASTVSLDVSVTVGDLTLDSGDTLAINASRTLTVAGPNDSNADGVVTNAGILNVQSGTTKLAGGGTHSGTFNVAAGATIEFAGGTHTITTGGFVPFTGPTSGTILISDGVVNRATGIIDDGGPTISMTGGEFNNVGGNITGGATMAQSGGTHNVTDVLQIGVANGSTGTYALSGGEMNITSNDFTGGLRVGYAGGGNFILSDSGLLSAVTNVAVGVTGTSNGTFTQAGGVALIDSTHSLFIGRDAGSHGTYDLQNGVLSVGGNLQVGFSGTGAVIQTGGAAAVGGFIFIGNGVGSSGSYAVTGGGTLTVTNGILIGGDAANPGGTGTLTVADGGTIYGPGGMTIWPNGTLNLNADGHIYLGDTPADNIRCEGIINNNGGTMDFGGRIYGAGTINHYSGNIVFSNGSAIDMGDIAMDGGSATAFGTLLVGKSPGSDGILNIAGGTMDVLGVLGVGNTGVATAGTGTGHVNISGGTLNADTILLGSSVGGSGDMTVSGTGQVIVQGGITTNDLIVTGGSVEVIDGPPPPGEDPVLERAIVAGYLHNGALHVSGGTVTTPILKLGVSSGKTGTFTQSNGTVNIVQLQVGFAGGGTGAATWSGGSLTVRDLELAGNGTMTIAAGANKTLALEILSIAGAGKLNLQDNKLIVRQTQTGSWNGSAYTDVTGLIASGRNGGVLPLWDGDGIVTSQTNATGGNFHSIGIALASDIKPITATETALWAGQTIVGSDTLVMYTYGGDANLDGKINIDDYVAIDQGIASNLTGWSNGDFNYDGKINIDDYTTVIDSNIGNQNGYVFTTGSGVGAGLNVVAVPEPTVLGVVLGATAILRRRRRNG